MYVIRTSILFLYTMRTKLKLKDKIFVEYCDMNDHRNRGVASDPEMLYTL